MAQTRQYTETRSGWWTTAFLLAGVVLFVMELNAGLKYVESHLANLAPNFLDTVPAWGLAAFKLVESAFWSFGQLEAIVRTAPLVALPFALLGLALFMRGSMGFRRQQGNG